MFKRFSKNHIGYSRWDGTQQIEGLNADDILGALADDYVEDGNLQQALRRLMQGGLQTPDGRRTMGLRELMDRMRNLRQQQLNRYNMASGVMDDLQQKLEEIKQLEREGIQRRLDETDTSQDQPSPPGSQGEEDGQQSGPDMASLSPEQQARLQRLREEFQRRQQASTEGMQDNLAPS